MPRPKRCRKICGKPSFTDFSPASAASGESVGLALDEFEAIRLIDLENLTHEQCAAQMDISRTTVTEIYECARKKIADALVNGRRLIISGGNYRVCKNSGKCPKRYCR